MKTAFKREEEQWQLMPGLKSALAGMPYPRRALKILASLYGMDAVTDAEARRLVSFMRRAASHAAREEMAGD